MPRDKLLAEWFWTDRWMGSRAFLLPMEARGVYREMLTQSWRRGGSLPNDPLAIQRAIGSTSEEWTRSWPLIQHFWRIDGANLVNDTQLEVYRGAKSQKERASERARAAAQAMHKQRSSTAQAQLEHCPPSPSPSPSLSPSPTPKNPTKIQNHSKSKNPAEDPPPAPVSDARRHKPRFSGQRIAIFDWQHDELRGYLNGDAETFDLDGWYRVLDAEALSKGWMQPKRDGGAWMQAHFADECQRRGIALTLTAPKTTARDFTCRHEPACRTKADCTRRGPAYGAMR